LFDVSHMGQLTLSGPQAAQALESLIPMDVIGLAEGKQRYGLLLNEHGGIIDDLMFVNRGSELFLIVNGACKKTDIEHLQKHIGACCTVTPLNQQALLALQGPGAVAALQRMVGGVEQLVFMSGGWFQWQDAKIYVTRSGYTGEDGFEISLHQDHAEPFAKALLSQPEVLPMGLGARTSLRLEAGLCLYGNDIHQNTTPVQANLSWAIQKVRRSGGAREAGFPGANTVLQQLGQPQSLGRCRVGLIALERVPVREHTSLQNTAGETIGEVTSGLLSPSLDQPIAMAYVETRYAAPGSQLNAVVRNKLVPMQVSPLPFLPNRYHR